MTNEQSKAIRLADLIDANLAGAGDAEISAELRRLHAENEDYGSTIDYLTCENAEQIGEIVALKEQRDELLEVLRNLADLYDTDEGCRSLPEYIAARAAIAKAGGAA